MNTPPPPPDDPARMPEQRLRELIQRGRAELDEVDEVALARIWRAVAATLERQADAIAASSGDGGAAAAAPAPPTAAAPTSAPAEAPGDGAVASVTAIPRRASRMAGVVPMAAAAAIALVVGVGAGLAWPSGGDAPEPATLATYELEPLEGDEVGTVNAVLRSDEGVQTLEVDLSRLPATPGYHEVWLLDASTGALTSLGPVRPDNRYVVPPGTDLRTLTSLDVSAEPLDGDPTHSGESLLRGDVVWTG